MDGTMKEEAKIENNEIKEETPEEILPSHTVNRKNLSRLKLRKLKVGLRI